MPLENELVALYFSDFFIRNRRTLNTLCLFYDRLFLHDYFGIFQCVEAEGKSWVGNTDPRLLAFNWSFAGGLTADHLRHFEPAVSDLFDAFVLKGVAQGLGCRTGQFSPSFVIAYARTYGTFLKENHSLFAENVLSLCQTVKNPYLPSARLEGGVKLKLDTPEERNRLSLEQARKNNVRACVFEEDYHSLPLISDSEQDVKRWDRDAELLTVAIAEAAILGVIPTIADVPADEILEARRKLNDYLPPFRLAIKKAAWDIASAARSTSRDEVRRLSELYFRTRIQPAVMEIERKLANEDTRLRRRLLERGVDGTVLVAKALDPSEPLSKWDLVSSGLKSLMDIDESLEKRREARSPYEFLIRLPRLLRVSGRR